MNVYIINGYPGSGKDTFCDKVFHYLPKVPLPFCSPVFSTVDFVKGIAYKCGWKGDKTPKNRKFLSDLKNLLSEWEDIPYRKTCQKIEKYRKEMLNWDFLDKEVTVFIMSREPSEIDRFKKEFNAKSILVKRYKKDELELSNDSDSKVEEYNYDITIYNTGTLDALENAAKNFCIVEGLIKEDKQF